MSTFWTFEEILRQALDRVTIFTKRTLDGLT